MILVRAALLWLALAFLLPGSARADTAPNDHIGLNPFGIMGLLRYNVSHWSLSYERVSESGHGVLAAFTVGHLHDVTSGNELHIWNLGGQLGYRYHWSQASAPFVGVLAGYRTGFGYRETTEKRDFDVQQWSVLPQAGYRWWLPSLRSSITVAGGFGFGPYDVTPDDADAMADEAEKTAESALSATGLIAEFDVTFALAF